MGAVRLPKILVLTIDDFVSAQETAFELKGSTILYIPTEDDVSVEQAASEKDRVQVRLRLAIRTCCGPRESSLRTI